MAIKVIARDREKVCGLGYYSRSREMVAAASTPIDNPPMLASDESRTNGPSIENWTWAVIDTGIEVEEGEGDIVIFAVPPPCIDT